MFNSFYSTYSSVPLVHHRASEFVILSLSLAAAGLLVRNHLLYFPVPVLYRIPDRHMEILAFYKKPLRFMNSSVMCHRKKWGIDIPFSLACMNYFAKMFFQCLFQFRNLRGTDRLVKRPIATIILEKEIIVIGYERKLAIF